MQKITAAQIRYLIKRLLKTSGDVIERIPSKDDNIPTILVKSLSILDATYNLVRGETDPVQEYIDRFVVEKKVDGSFVGMFFVNLIKENFNFEHIPFGEERFAVKVDIPECNGFLIFIEDRYNGTSTRESTFYHSPEFNFDKLLNDSWDSYNGRIYVTLNKNTEDWRKPNQFTTFSFPQTKVFGVAKSRLDEMIERDKQYRIDGVPRAYLFIGLPGAGKSTFALKMVEHSKKVIKFDARSLDNLSIESVDFLLSGLQPEYIIVDDIDKIFFGNSNATLLHAMEHIKQNHPNTTVLLTANQIEKMDPALLRPGRVDEIIEFACHDESERKDIIVGYCELLERELDQNNVDRLVKATAGLTAAYLKEAVIQLKYLSIDRVIDNINKTKNLLGIEEITDNDSDDDDKEETVTPLAKMRALLKH